MIKLFYYINLLFNVSNHEWPRIILSWLLKMIVHAAFVMSSTILLALFVEKYGITQLPYMYIISAAFVVVGSVLFAFVVERFEKKTEIILITILASILFFCTPFLQDSPMLFYGALFVAISIFISQLNIGLALFIEELFSPLESERTFPIIESSEPIGGIVAGAVLTIGVTLFQFSAIQLLKYTAGLLFLAVPVMLIFLKQANKVPGLETNEEHKTKHQSHFERAHKGLRHIKGLPFLKGMLIVVFLHFTFVNLVEFQYTSVLDHSLHEEHGSHGSTEHENHDIHGEAEHEDHNTTNSHTTDPHHNENKHHAAHSEETHHNEEKHSTTKNSHESTKDDSNHQETTHNTEEHISEHDTKDTHSDSHAAEKQTTDSLHGASEQKEHNSKSHETNAHDEASKKTNKVRQKPDYNTEKNSTKDNHQNSHGDDAAHGDNAHSHADALTHGLAFWHVMFSIIAFLAQTLSASRINKKLGVIRSMSIHPYINILSGFIMLFRFGFFSGILGRGVFEVTTMMHRTSYHASFYALKRSIREQVKEFMEGIIRPVGVIFGTLLLSVILKFIPEEFQHTVITICMVIIMFIMLIVLNKMKAQYTNMAKKNLKPRNSNMEKIEALEILAQRGHEKVTDVLGKNLNDKSHAQVQIRILNTIGAIQDIDSIPDILKAFDSKHKTVRIAAVKALAQYNNLGNHFFSQSFAKYRVLKSLEKLFINERSKKIKSAVIEVFKNIQNADIIPFLLKNLDTEDTELLADAIHICGLFNDVNSAFYIEKYLQSNIPQIKSAAVISLWSFQQYRLPCLMQINSMIESKDEEMKVSGIYSLGEIEAIQEIPRLERFIAHENLTIQCHALVSLAKMNKSYVLHKILKFLFCEDQKLSNMTKNLINSIPEENKKIFDRILRQEVSLKIQKILLDSKTDVLEEIELEKLKKLREYYMLINAVREVIQIEEEMAKRETLQKKAASSTNANVKPTNTVSSTSTNTSTSTPPKPDVKVNAANPNLTSKPNLSTTSTNIPPKPDVKVDTNNNGTT